MRRAQMGREDLGEYSVVHDDSWWRLGQCSHAWWHSSCRGHNYSRLGERKILTNTARSVAHDDSWRLGERSHAWWHSSCRGHNCSRLGEKDPDQHSRVGSVAHDGARQVGGGTKSRRVVHFIQRTQVQ